MSDTEASHGLFPRHDAFVAICDKPEQGRVMTDVVLSIVMLAALALVAGAFVLWRRTGETKQPALMVVLAVIAVLNVLIWTIPSDNGTAPIEQIETAGEG